MNKLFTKIASLALGAAMVVGVGVAIGVDKSDAGQIHAAEGDTLYSSGQFSTVSTHSYTQNKTFTLSSRSWTASVSQVNSSVFYLGCNSNNASKGQLQNNTTFTAVFNALKAADSHYNSNYSSCHAYALLFENAYNTVGEVTFTWNGGNNAFQIYLFGDKGSGYVLLDSENYATSGASVSGSVSWTATGNGENFTKFAIAARAGTTSGNATNKTLRPGTFVIKEGSSGGECDHNWVAQTTHNPTCTEQGYTDYECSLCHDTKQDDFVDALGHNYGEWIVDTAATCTTAGAKHRVCSRDASHVENEVIPATGHTYVDGVCSVCGAEEPQGYTLVTDASKLVANTTFILLHETSDTVAIGGWSTSYFTTTTASVSGSVATSDTAMVFTLEGTSGAWNIKSGDYYYGIQNSTTALRSSTASGDNYSWTITISNGIATMKSAGSGARSLCYNGGANPVRYSAYTASSTYTQVRIFAIIPATTKTVTYNANGATDGTVPTDSTKYDSGDTVTVLTNSGSLAKTGFTFNGWNTKNDGSGTHYAASGSATFTITDNTTLYAEWVKTLDAITAIGGSVSATLSNAGTYNWDFSNVTVSGTLSGETGQDVKTYVDLSSTTAIPSSIGSCTVSVTATKKSTAPGSANPLTNNSVSGEVEAPKLVYTFTMTQADLLQTGISYANENAHAKSSTATCAGHDNIEIAWATNQVMKSTTDMQFQTTNGYLYNTTEIPGTITNVTVTATAQSFNVFYGDTEHPTSGTTPGGKYFTVQGVGSTPKASEIVVTFEVSDKPKVQLVASNITCDVADGASTPTITDGTSAVTGYHLISEDSYIASITNDGKVQPVSYGKVIIQVTKDEDSGHIYLATTFTVTVGDHSKEVSTMEFVEKAGGSATADDGVEWTINSGSVSENDFSDVYGINFGTNGTKISSLTLTTPADDERIVKNVVVEAMSATDGSTISVTVGETSFVCNKSNSLTGSVSTFNFSGNVSGDITITMSGTASTKYGVKSIAILYVGDEATSFASTFLTAVVCNSSGTSKPTFSIKEGSTYWTWALLASEFGELSADDKAKFAPNATGVSSAISECVARYDYIVGKYFKTGLDTSFTDFMSRNPSPIGSGSIVLKTITESVNSTAIIIVTAMIGLSAAGGYFFLRKRKEN